ncbi:hypothetical protein [Colwellia sp. MEBiC06753]
MTLFKSITAVIFVITLSACSSTSDNTYTSEKRPLTNDTELLISLLKRPTTADQIMMAQFAQTRAAYFDLPQVSYVQIGGDSVANSDTDSSFQQPHHLDVLYQAYNSNFVTLSGPN